MIQEFLQKAEENLRIARVAFDQAAYNASVNRSYYASFQAAIAALAAEGLKKKGGIRTIGCRRSLRVCLFGSENSIPQH